MEQLAVSLKGLVLALTLLQTTLAAPIPTNEVAQQPAPIIEAAQTPVESREYHPKIELLAMCESTNRPNIRIVDTNGYYSYGALQFQLGTFISYGKKYGILEKDITQDEARTLIFRADLQRAIATEMLKEVGGWRHWTNCAKKIGLNT